jgi:trigger factor
MQVTEVQSEGLKRQFQITVEASAIEAKVNARLNDLAKRVKLPGFRPGKVPPSVMKQRYGQSIMGEVLEETVNDVTNQAMTDRGLRPAMKPTVEIVSFDQGKDLQYKVDVEVLPEVSPTDFGQLQIERLQLEPTDQEVDTAVERIAAGNKKAAEPAEARPVREGDLVTIDFAGTVDGKELPGMKGEDFRLEVGSKQFIPGFEEQLIGAAIGESREVKVTFPADYPAENLKGKEAVFQVAIKKLEEQSERPADDSLAKDLGLDSLDQLKGRVREQMTAEYRNLAKANLKRRVLDALAAAHDFAVPDGMVDLEFQAIWQQIERDREAGQLDPEDRDKSEEELRSEYRGIAERRVRLGLLLSEVGRRQNVEVTQDEINNAIMAEVRRFPGQEQQVMNFFRNNAQAVANVRAPIFEQKVIDWIVDQAKVTDRPVTLEEFNQIAEDAPKASEREAAAQPA